MKRGRTILMTMVLGALTCAGAFAVYEAQSRSIVSVRVAGDLRFTRRDALEQSIAGRIDTSLYRVDVSEIRNGVVELAWVKDASVRRVWPDSLHIAVLEREPVARWGARGLVEADGEIFAPDNADHFDHLPLLEGPAGTETRVLETYWQMQSALRPLAWEVRRVHLSARRAWLFELDNQIQLQLGQNIHKENVEQLVRAFQSTLADHLHEIERVDLRYVNGFAIRWKHTLQAQAGEEQG